MLYPPRFYYVKKPKRFVILSSDKSSERNLSCFFDTKKPSRIEHLQSEEPFTSDPYFNIYFGLNEKSRSGYELNYQFSFIKLTFELQVVNLIQLPGVQHCFQNTTAVAALNCHSNGLHEIGGGFLLTCRLHYSVTNVLDEIQGMRSKRP